VLYYSQRVREEPPAKKNNMKNKTRFLNATIKVKRNPEYKGNHELAPRHGRTDSFLGCTYPLGTTEQEMIDGFHGQKIGIIKGKTWLMGEMVRVERVERVECFGDKG
jgi:hypothetical protein